jgi:hypothetical protein
MWAGDRDEIQTNPKQIMSPKRTMVLAYFCRGGCVSIEFSPDGQK